MPAPRKYPPELRERAQGSCTARPACAPGSSPTPSGVDDSVRGAVRCRRGRALTFALSRRLRQYVHAHSFPPAEGYTSWNEEAVDDMLGGLSRPIGAPARNVDRAGHNCAPTGSGSAAGDSLSPWRTNVCVQMCQLHDRSATAVERGIPPPGRHQWSTLLIHGSRTAARWPTPWLALYRPSGRRGSCPNSRVSRRQSRRSDGVADQAPGGPAGSQRLALAPRNRSRDRRHHSPVPAGRGCGEAAKL